MNALIKDFKNLPSHPKIKILRFDESFSTEQGREKSSQRKLEMMHIYDCLMLIFEGVPGKPHHIHMYAFLINANYDVTFGICGFYRSICTFLSFL